jgi:hypothetical protein
MNELLVLGQALCLAALVYGAYLSITNAHLRNADSARRSPDIQDHVHGSAQDHGLRVTADASANRNSASENLPARL